MVSTLTQLKPDTWVKATWDDYLKVEENPDYLKAKIYFDRGNIRIEMSPLGNDHASDHSIISHGVNLYCNLKEIELNGKDNCTYQRTGYQGAQPDLSYYIGDRAEAIPYGTGVIDLDQYPPPSLVIKIANSSLADDLGAKRLLYEKLGTSEYWIVDVQNQRIIAFSISDGGSKQIFQSQVLWDLEITIFEKALQKTRQQSHSKVGAWLLQQFH
jgi:Uma2 family endonuclease